MWNKAFVKSDVGVLTAQRPLAMLGTLTPKFKWKSNELTGWPHTPFLLVPQEKVESTSGQEIWSPDWDFLDLQLPPPKKTWGCQVANHLFTVSLPVRYRKYCTHLTRTQTELQSGYVAPWNGSFSINLLQIAQALSNLCILNLEAKFINSSERWRSECTLLC